MKLPSIVLLLVVGSSAQKGIPSVCPYPVTWDMKKSTIIMPCNESGFTNPDSTVGWGIVDFDWSNAKKMWAAAKPMNCEEMLVEQVKQTTTASPGTTVWVYRNGIKALPWYTLVRTKISDPDYKAWFMNFSPAVIANHSASHVPVCDTNYDPPLCSDLYHDQSQTPGYPHGDGNCAAPGCDVGSVPVGEYLFDPRAANVSIHGQTFVEWYVDEYLFGPTGAGNPNISGFYFDDHWTAGGPSEMSRYAAADMGLSTSDLQDLVSAFNWVQAKAYSEILKRGKFSWNQFWNGGGGTDPNPERTAWIDCPDPMVTPPNSTKKGAGPAKCAADVKALCDVNSYAQKYAMIYTFSPGCHGSTSKILDPDADVAAFLATRGGHAWLGHGWSGCSKVYERPASLDVDYGEPIDKVCKETAPGSNVFLREWTKATVKVDCNTWKNEIIMKKDF